MGRRKKSPTKVVSLRISKIRYEKLKKMAELSGKNVSQIYKEIINKYEKYD